MPNCEVCGRDQFETPLFRVNKKGVPAIWRCEEDMESPPDPEIKEITDTIGGL